MRLVVDGILTQKLSWGLILVGAFFTVALEILGLSSLPVAVGLYLPISTSAGIFAGGAVRWLAERAAQRARRGTGVPAPRSATPRRRAGRACCCRRGSSPAARSRGSCSRRSRPTTCPAGINLEERLGALGTNALLAFGVFVLAILVPLYRTARRTS
jgi:hypothetical protein